MHGREGGAQGGAGESSVGRRVGGITPTRRLPRDRPPQPTINPRRRVHRCATSTSLPQALREATWAGTFLNFPIRHPARCSSANEGRRADEGASKKDNEGSKVLALSISWGSKDRCLVLPA